MLLQTFREIEPEAGSADMIDGKPSATSILEFLLHVDGSWLTLIIYSCYSVIYCRWMNPSAVVMSP